MGKAEYVKRAYIPVFQNKRKYMLFKEDLSKIFKVRKFKAPPVPSFDSEKENSHSDE